jgi:putative ABC transport system permease protein
LASIDGVPADKLNPSDGGRRFINTAFVLTWSKELPPATEILKGEWWHDKPQEPLVSVNENAADGLGIDVGKIIEWNAPGGLIRARVASIRRSDGARPGNNNQFILSPGALDGFATAYFGALRVRPGGIGPLQMRVFEKYPTVTVVNAADIMAVVQDVLDKTSQAVRFVAGFAIFGGLIVLASSVAGTRYRRMREAAIFKTVGGTRRRLIQILSTEFAVIGAAAGLLGSVIATLLSAILVGELLDSDYHFRWFPALIATVISAVLTVSAGWLASYGVLRRKPLEILREIE